jgi:thiol-disulfide isomerase/thioredoxin
VRNLARCLLIPLFAASLTAHAAASPSPEGALQGALKQAEAQGSAVIVDFHAPWCYSCYYMAGHVLTGADWDAVRKRAVIVEADADAPEGAALQARWQIKALPAYLVLDAQGREIGRILGEQTRADFYTALDALLDQGDSIDTLQLAVRRGDEAAPVAARKVLAAYLARQDADAGLDWYAELTPELRARLDQDPGVRLTLARLKLLQDVAAKDTWACLADGGEVLSGDLGCERPYELQRYLSCAGGQSDARDLLRDQRPAMSKLVESGVFGASACADQRSIVLTTVDLYQKLGDDGAADALLHRAIEKTRRTLGENLASDRNLADNLRVYLERYGNADALDALMVQLIDAYPDDYVYPFRYGRSLLARGDAEAALPYLERAAKQAYGINRLKVAEQRVRALQQLGRERDARKVVAQALKANGPWFEVEAAALKALLQPQG